MKKEFIKPEIAVSNFDMENIVTDSVIPTNRSVVSSSLDAKMNSESGAANGGIADIILEW